VDPDVDTWLDGPQPWRQTRRLARALTAIEAGKQGRALARAVHRRTGRAVIVRLTGPPGVGQSTRVAALGRELRNRGVPVGILAFDPTSPLTGGAVLGDRVRMADLETDSAVFIRSMASRGAGGGLAQAAAEATDLLDAAGFPWILIETVGAGQAQTAIRRSSDVVLLVAAPGLGDGVQAIKGGTMEIADVHVVNKSDLPGAGIAFRAIAEMLPPALDGGHRPVVQAVARTGEGAAEVLDAVSGCFERLEAAGEIAARRSSRQRRRVLDLYLGAVSRLALDALPEERLARGLAPAKPAGLDEDEVSQQNRASGIAGPVCVDLHDLAERLVSEFVDGLRQGGTDRNEEP